MTDQILTLDQVELLAYDLLTKAGASPLQATAVAKSTRLAERDGIRSHGLLYIPIYAEHLKCGKVIGRAQPVVKTPKAGSVCVDAQNGFAHGAIDAGWNALTSAAKSSGIAAMTLFNSYNCGVLGHHAERLAQDGFVGLCFTHAPASIAPWGGSKPVIGTNPFALGVPSGEGAAAFVVDQSASVIAKSEILLRSKSQTPLEEGWAVDNEGHPTTDAHAALQGSLLPAGKYKGFGIGLMVEVLAAVLSGANLSQNASPFAGTAGGPPSTGQCFIAIDPYAFSGAGFFEQIKILGNSIVAQEGAQLPGTKRAKNRLKTETNGVVVDHLLWDRLQS
jgi:(2R)-3-sulfolactate dehydrogenase (NADP+)